MVPRGKIKIFYSFGGTPGLVVFVLAFPFISVVRRAKKIFLTKKNRGPSGFVGFVRVFGFIPAVRRDNFLTKKNSGGRFIPVAVR